MNHAEVLARLVIMEAEEFRSVALLPAGVPLLGRPRSRGYLHRSNLRVDQYLPRELEILSSLDDPEREPSSVVNLLESLDTPLRENRLVSLDFFASGGNQEEIGLLPHHEILADVPHRERNGGIEEFSVGEGDVHVERGFGEKIGRGLASKPDSDLCGNLKIPVDEDETKEERSNQDEEVLVGIDARVTDGDQYYGDEKPRRGDGHFSAAAAEDSGHATDQRVNHGPIVASQAGTDVSARIS
jgi:hypothetical protein